MAMSDGENSDGGRRTFRAIKPARTSGSRKRSVDDILGAALLNYSSDEDMPRSRRLAAIKNLRRSSANEGGNDGGAGDEGAARIKVKRAKTARPQRLQAMQEPSEEEDVENDPAKMLEETMRFLDGVDPDNPDDKENAQCMRAKRLKARQDLRRKIKNKGGQTKVLLEENGQEASPDKPDELTPEKEARLRNFGQGFGKGKGRGQNGNESEEEELEEDVLATMTEAWEADIAGRVDKKHPDCPTTAFSIKPCAPSSIRTLKAECFLGKKRPEEGGLPLIDADGLVNVHFLLGTYKQLQKLKERRQRGDKTGDDVDKADRAYMKWMIIKALKLRVISKQEMSQGRVNQARMKQAQKSQKWSLSRGANLVDHSDVKEDELTPDLQFKGAQRPANFKEISERNRAQLKQSIESRQKAISVVSSSNVDMEDMQSRLMAPSMSFDWEEKGSDDEENMLEVDMPEMQGFSSKRDLFKDQLQRSKSFQFAKGLTNRTKSNLSRSFSANSLPEVAAATPNLERAHSAPDQVSTEPTSTATASSEPNGKVTLDKSQDGESLEKAAVSSLWEVLESEEKTSTTETPATSSVAGAPDAQEAKEVVPEAAEGKPASSGFDKTGVSLTTEAADPSADEPVQHTEQPSDAVHQGDRGKSPAKPDKLQKFWEQGMDIISKLDTTVDANEIKQNSAAPPAETKTSSDKDADAAETRPASSSQLDPTTPNTQDIEKYWRDVTRASESSESGTGDTKNPSATDAGANSNLEISPTMPFLPKQGQEQPMEISPTAAFVAKPATEKALEISPTAPFVAKSAAGSHLEISPTAPFVPRAVEPQVEISPTMPFVPSEKPAGDDLSGVHAGTGAAAGSTNAAKTAEKSSEDPAGASSTSSKPAQPSAASPDEDSLSEDASEDGENPEEDGFKQNEKQRKREREWLRHKRKAARQEVKDTVPSKRRKAQKDDGSDADEADDFAAFGAPAGGMLKKKSFLMK